MGKAPRRKHHSLETLTARADAGDSDAMFELGKRYYQADDGGTRHPDVRQWWFRAAELGHARAMFGLGALYARGHGVQQDHLRARHWWRRAADLGDAQAIHNLNVLGDARGDPAPYPAKSSRPRASDGQSLDESGCTNSG